MARISESRFRLKPLQRLSFRPLRQISGENPMSCLVFREISDQSSVRGIWCGSKVLTIGIWTPTIGLMTNLVFQCVCFFWALKSEKRFDAMRSLWMAMHMWGRGWDVVTTRGSGGFFVGSELVCHHNTMRFEQFSRVFCCCNRILILISI